MGSVGNDRYAHSLESRWSEMSEAEKIRVINESAEMEPELAIVPVMAGISAYHFSVRSAARKGLERIRHTIAKLLNDPDNIKNIHKGIRASASVCARLYSQIQTDTPRKEKIFFLKNLLGFEGKGPFFAYMTVYKGKITLNVLEQVMLSLPDAMRLVLVDQYLQAVPSVRLKFGTSFLRIVRSIRQREAVMRFYARLFDRQRDADPFLNNLSQNLRDPDVIRSTELSSLSPEMRIMGLKALSMITSRIPSDLILNMLTRENDKNVRMCICQIIEHSSMGLYADLSPSIQSCLSTSDPEEAFQVFKALVVSGGIPLYELLQKVKDNHSFLLPLINDELSRLSRLSFFIIQDMALHKEKYLKDHFDVNLACVLGMIRKRPERVVGILKKYDNETRDDVRKGVIGFIERTKDLLSQEKQQIETEFAAIVQKVGQDQKKGKNFIRTLFADSTEKKIELLRTSRSPSDVHLNGETISDANLSSAVFPASRMFFVFCVFNNCNLSRSIFSQAFFNKTVFYNIDMRQARFESVCFDHCVFINVDAEGALFSQCSFQNISIFNSSFNHAELADAPFIQATVSKTSFHETNLSCSSFVNARLSAISFVTSNIDQADFSGVSARFCRFPAGVRSMVRLENIDYNARRFQLSFEDMPQMDEVIVSDIDRLIFSEFIHYGEMKFYKQNQFSLLTAFDIFRSRQADLFQIIPFLLHENCEFPGIPSLSKQTPAGIHDYMPSLETQTVLRQYLKKEHTAVRRSIDPCIEGLFTIGSTGSIAQTVDSDIDYWVCVHENQLGNGGLPLLKKKLEMIEQMAWEQFSTKITFFLVDILKAKNNDFGDSTIESSGSAQSRLLKEEFYRTMIHVAGKIPLWSVLPVSVSINYYNSILEDLSSMPNPGRYIDLGDIHAIPTSEYYGASIWQMFKWLKSPFKSVIKMALLEKYIYDYGKESLLCNQYKDEWMNSGTQLKLARNDSYYILMKNLIRYFRAAGDEETVSLLLTCFFLKLGISKDSEIEHTVFGLRKILFEQCILKWGWTRDTIFRIGRFKTWHYADIARLSATIEKFMIRKYKTINAGFERNFKERSLISPEDRTVLGRKIFIEFSKQPGKIPKVLLISRSDRHFQGLQLKYCRQARPKGEWELINRTAKSHQGQDESLIKADTIEEIGAWLMYNHLYNENTIVHLVPNPTYVTFDDIRKLYRVMFDFFQPVLERETLFEQLLLKSRVTSLFISINFYAPRQQRAVTSYTAIYTSSWGEMFCLSFASDQGFPSVEEAKKDIMARAGIKKFPLNTAFYFSKGAAR